MDSQETSNVNSPSKIELNHLLPVSERNEDFTFETDSYALQDNKDYQQLLSCLFKLESQRIYVTEAWEEIKIARRKVKEDALKFVHQLQNGEVNFKPRIKIAEVPVIDMSKYDIASYIESLRPNTRKSIRESTFSSKPASDLHESSNTKNKPKSVTHNIAWTADEQRKLEELLIKYPDEPIASKRYAKIAKELGTRTLMQVQSRVQKYFIALKKEGLPIPGRDPKAVMIRSSRKRGSSCHVPASRKFMRAFDYGDSVENMQRQFLTKMIPFDIEQSNTVKPSDVMKFEDLQSDTSIS